MMKIVVGMDWNRVKGKFQIQTNKWRKKHMAKESGNNPVPGLQCLNRMVSEPYYLFHFLTFFSYFVIRSSASQVLAPHLVQHLLRRVKFYLPFALSHGSSLITYLTCSPSLRKYKRCLFSRYWLSSRFALLKSDRMWPRFFILLLHFPKIYWLIVWMNGSC